MVLHGLPVGRAGWGLESLHVPPGASVCDRGLVGLGQGLPNFFFEEELEGSRIYGEATELPIIV